MPPDTRSDDELLDEARAGDAPALSGLLDRHAAALHARLARQVPRRWQAMLSADDLLQQTFTDVFLDIGSFTPCGEGAFAAWLGTLARNNLRDAVRFLEAEKRGGHRARGGLGSDESVASLSELLLAESRSSPTRHAARAEEIERLRQAIAALPPLYRQVVEDYDLGGRAVAEVAAQLGRSPGAVYLLRHRAHRRLQQLLGVVG